MTRRRFVRNGALACLSLASPPMLNFGRVELHAAATVPVSTHAVDLVLGNVVIDMLGLLTLDWAKLFRWQRRAGSFGARDFNGLGLSGVKVFHPAVDTGLTNPAHVAQLWLAGWDRLLGSQICRLARIETATDLVRIPETGRIGVIVGFQNSNHFQTVDDVARSFALGQRVSQLTYNEANKLGSGCYVRRDRGLTRFGGEIVEAMNDAGMAIDVSHCGERTSLDAIASSRKPVLVTHGNCRALNPGQPRCKSDEVLRKMAAKGGVLGISVVRAFVGRTPTLDGLLDHFAHAAKIAGIEHVGLGSDLDVEGIDPRSGRPHSFYAIQGLDPVARVFQIADGLLRRGYSDRDVELVLGRNFIRALGESWPQTRSDPRAFEWKRDPFCPASPRVVPPKIARR
ncbi:MAG: membrane dipeptidase [Acidobacteria bacterium]|nr:membrane dipeptidase [Acidobacteriota bacterium]